MKYLLSLGMILLLIFVTVIVYAAMNINQIKTAYENGDRVYYAPQSVYDYLNRDRKDLPGAPFSANTNIPNGIVNQIIIRPEYDPDTDTWTDNVYVSVNGLTLPSSRLFISRDALKATLKTALTNRAAEAAAIAALDTAYAASVDEIGVPVLLVSEEVLDFGSSETSLSFDISNDGDGKLDYTITTSLPTKVTITPNSGNCIDDTDTITVTVSRSGVSPGTYYPTVDIASDGGSATVTLTVVVL
jgi:hypothetical protein